jgi:hypothetical protein
MTIFIECQDHESEDVAKFISELAGRKIGAYIVSSAYLNRRSMSSTGKIEIKAVTVEQNAHE